MKKEIFSTPEFEELQQNELVFFNADFPRMRKNKLSKELTLQNEGLAEKYNRTGAFPLTVLIKPDGTVLHSREGLPKISVKEFISEVRGFLPQPQIVKKKSTAEQ